MTANPTFGSAQIPDLDQEPFCVTRRKLFTLFGSPRLTQRMIAAGWITAIRPGAPGRETLYDFQSAKAAFHRLKNGEEPPLLPCEKSKGGER
jgi:hypothetical protein